MGNREKKKSGQRGTGEKEGVPAIKAPIGSILRSLAAAKFRLRHILNDRDRSRNRLLKANYCALIGSSLQSS